VLSKARTRLARRRDPATLALSGACQLGDAAPQQSTVATARMLADQCARRYRIICLS